MIATEPKEGFEPPTSRLQGGCSDRTELHRLNEVAAEALDEPLSTFQRNYDTATCVPPAGFEPATRPLRVACSKPLSYEGKFFFRCILSANFSRA